MLPKFLQAFTDGWSEDKIEKEGFTVMMMDEYSNIGFNTKIRANYLSMADNTIEALTRKGLPVDSINILGHILSDSALLQIVEFTTDQLVNCGHVPTSLIEYKKVLLLDGCVVVFDWVKSYHLITWKLLPLERALT